MSSLAGIGACLHYPSPVSSGERILLVMLPGAGIDARDFAAQGLVAAAQARGAAVDVIALKPELDLYLEGRVAAVLHDAVIAPALAGGVRRLWLLGISLGGMGALLYASIHPELVEGVVLLAPFLGTHGTMAEVAQAGRFASWSAATSAATAPERQMLTWLQGQLRAGAQSPRLFLGHGDRDRFGVGHRLLAAELPPDQVALVDGGHDWAAWTKAWDQILARDPFR
jgi:pimeloyl-ACP methyl ester carboxylesterase